MYLDGQNMFRFFLSGSTVTRYIRATDYKRDSVVSIRVEDIQQAAIMSRAAVNVLPVMS